MGCRNLGVVPRDAVREVRAIVGVQGLAGVLGGRDGSDVGCIRIVFATLL